MEKEGDLLALIRRKRVRDDFIDPLQKADFFLLASKGGEEE